MALDPSFAVIIPIGPSGNEIDRCRDTLDSLFHYEPACRRVVLIDDTPLGRKLETVFSVPPTCQIVSLVNPRQGRGQGWSDGLGSGVIAGMTAAFASQDIEFALRMDTDTLIVRAFARQIQARLAADSSLGLLGTFRLYPDGRPRVKRENVDMLTRLLPWFRPYRLSQRSWPQHGLNLVGRGAKRRRLLRAALDNGYTLGDFVQGGGYAISAAMMRSLAAAPDVDPAVFIGTQLGEDVSTTVLCYAAGLHAEDCNQSDEPFGVAFLGLPMTKEELVARNYAILHSVKDYESFSEAETRAFFKHRRENGL